MSAPTAALSAAMEAARLCGWFAGLAGLPPPPGALSRRLVLPRCGFCGRRPEMREAGSGELYLDTFPDSGRFADDLGEFVRVPRYEVLPCCSAVYRVENEGPSRLQRLRAREASGKRGEKR